MAKNFEKAGSAKKFEEVAKASNEKANVIRVVLIADKCLVDHPRNGEDLSFTEDIETSIQQNGFTDPIEVTDFGMEEGKYTIISGHRRRMAGRKQGIETFPCIVRKFDSGEGAYNALLLANAQRDSSKDPLLYCKRYKMHEEYLRDSKFKGSIREEIARRLGISTQQADRYNQFNKVILSVWDLVRSEKVGMSSVLGMATLDSEQQEKVLEILLEADKQGVTLTRPVCDMIIKGYKSGKTTYAEIANASATGGVKDSGLPLNAFINPEPSETREPDTNRNNEVNREYDPIAAELDREEKDPYASERLTQEDYETIEAVAKGGGKDKVESEKKPPLSEEEKQQKRGMEISKHLEALEKIFNEVYTLPDSDTAELCMKTMQGVISMAIDEMYNMGQEYQKDKVFKQIVEDIAQTMEQYK